MLRVLTLVISLSLLAPCSVGAEPAPQPQTQASTQARQPIPVPAQPHTSQASTGMFDKPLIERYVLDELKALRQELQDLERRLTVDITDRELAVADKSLNYANVTVTYFFYIIAGVASLIAFIGWQSLREIKANTIKLAAEQLQTIADQYEAKFKLLEQELKRKTNIISENNREIEIINEVHTLWLHAQSAQTPEQKIEVYDEILTIRPGDLEALTYKADAAMEMREFNWALSLCNRVLEVDTRNAHALYQRACALSCLGIEDRAISDLERAIENSASFKEVAAQEDDFNILRDNPRFEALISHQD
jgi:tetratricopeptide (TPR) repeat protein